MFIVDVIFHYSFSSFESVTVDKNHFVISKEESCSILISILCTHLFLASRFRSCHHLRKNKYIIIEIYSLTKKLQYLEGGVQI